jgi:hypothetical protein
MAKRSRRAVKSTRPARLYTRGVVRYLGTGSFLDRTPRDPPADDRAGEVGHDQIAL